MPFWRGFHFRLLLALGLPLLAVIVVMGLFTYRTLVDSRLATFRQRLASVALALSQTVDISRADEVDLDSPDSPEWVKDLHDRLRHIAEREGDIESIYIMLPTAELGRLRFLLDASILTRVASKGEYYDATDIPYMLKGFEEVTVEDRIYSDGFGDTQSSYAPLRDETGAVVGVLGVDVLAVRIEAIRDRVLSLCLLIFGPAALVVVVLTVLIGRWVRSPLQRLFAAANAVAAGDLDVRLSLDRRDEFGVVAGQFDRMTNRLRHQRCLRDTFGLYVSRELAERLLDPARLPALGGEECEGTILFLDLCGYTRVSEQLTPKETIDMLNHYLGAVIAIIEEHKGCVLDIMGDAIIAIFGAPLPLPDHAPKALDCALRVRKCLDRLNADWERQGIARRWQDEGIARIEVRLGLHTGLLIAGNIGSASRMKFSVVGDTVNVAARLEQLNKELNTGILFTEELRSRLRPEQTVGLTDHGQVAVRGRSQPIRVWSA